MGDKCLMEMTNEWGVVHTAESRSMMASEKVSASVFFSCSSLSLDVKINKERSFSICFQRIDTNTHKYTHSTLDCRV